MLDCCVDDATREGDSIRFGWVVALVAGTGASGVETFFASFGIASAVDAGSADELAEFAGLGVGA